MTEPVFSIRSLFSKRDRFTYPRAEMPEDKLTSRTQQHFAGESDVNSIVRRAKKGVPLPLRISTPLYGDFTSGVDFQDSMNRIAVAKSNFEMLPSDLRLQFHNDPAELLDFINDPENLEEAIELGLLSAPAPALEVPPAPEPASEPVPPSEPSPEPPPTA